jgi:hypothetical protein
VVTGATEESKYLAIEEGEIYRDISIDELVSKLSKIENDPLIVGYDIHAGFNFPDNRDLRKLFEGLDKNILLEPTIIDEREQSGKNSFSPTQVYVELKGKSQRRRVAKSKSTFVSQLWVDYERILNAYRELSDELYEEVEPLVNKVRIRYPKNLGEFLAAMHHLLLIEQLRGLSNLSISDIRFDKYNPEKGKVDHPETRHKNHDILYIGLHKITIGYERELEYLVDKFTKVRKEGLLGEKPRYIITPLNPRTYFRR